ncbi:glycosyltransferase family 4 protein [Spirochaetia bacterium 38H-sp]|uniref:Glycosyltransferase family 4 protein n=1 Tax=Rarispira pelagica TaxID=3141764 RepID=A0ABU9UDK6_9SPIR
MSLKIGFISFRISGTDGVSLETKKWADVLERMGAECFYMAGQLDTPKERSFVAEEAHFQTQDAKALYYRCFYQSVRDPETTRMIHERRAVLKKRLYQFVEKFDLDLLIPQNILAIPLNIPLALAFTEFVAETGFKVIAHHHDFFWERKRFLHNCVWDYLNSAYPPHLASIHHVVINSSAQNQLGLRTGISSTLIPNVMEFEKPPEPVDEYAKDVREALGVRDDELFILQPTRVVQRKGIEHAIEFVARLGMPAKLVISHASGDEGHEYEQRVRDYAKLLGVDAIFGSDIIGETRGRTPDGRKIYSLSDIYPHANLVTYPSIFEGFGNAFLEAIYFKKPILINNYSIYSHDIRPKGFKCLEMDEFISGDTIDTARELLARPDIQEEWAETNYKLARQFYSYTVLRTKLTAILVSQFGYTDLSLCQ